MSATIAVLASRVRFEEKQIMAAVEARGLDVEHLDPRTLWVGDRAGSPENTIVINREIGQVRALYAADALESTGASVFNNAAATRLCGDKWFTASALHRAGLPTPRSIVALTPEAALKALEEIGYPAVIKPLVGSWGRMVTRVGDRSVAEAVLEHVAALPSPQSHVVLVQELVQHANCDLRVIVIGGQVLGATRRHGVEWRTNVARGAVSAATTLTPGQAQLAVDAAGALGADIAGVDLLEDGEGTTTVLEVNDRVEFRGFQTAHADRVDVAQAIVTHVLRSTGA